MGHCNVCGKSTYHTHMTANLPQRMDVHYRIALEEIRDRDNLDAAAMKAIAAHALAK